MKKPIVGEIWVKIDQDDDENEVGDKVLITEDPVWEVAWKYLPQPSPYRDNAWTLQAFLRYYKLDEVELAKKILLSYEETDTKNT
jgi:hypothetical protein